MLTLAVIFLVLLGGAAGTLIGLIGIGGVILVPAMHYVGGIALPVAIAAAMMGYLLTGLIGTTIYARAGSIRWGMAGWLCAGAMPAALAGAWLSNTLPPWVLEAAVALLTLFSGIRALTRPASADGSRALGSGTLVASGSATGVLSALTGTGGPLILVPLMIWLGQPMLTAIGLAQAVQLPIAALATAGNYAFGAPDALIGLTLGAGLAIGSYTGARLAHRAPKALLEKIVAAVLITVGLVILARLFGRLVL